MMDKSYNIALVVLSVVVATLGGYVAVEIGQRIRNAGMRHRIPWTCGGALAMGLGIWSMHFVGMLALTLPVPVWYDPLLTFGSVVAAVIACAIAFIIFNRVTVGGWLLSFASVLMGAAIAGMHYLGMAGMLMGGNVIYDPVIVGISIGVAIGVSFLALALTRNLLQTGARGPLVKKLAASLAFALAVAGTHYTGMAAAQFTRH
jgi:diguanylate cyclase